MKEKFKLKRILLTCLMLGFLTNLQAQKQTVSETVLPVSTNITQFANLKVTDYPSFSKTTSSMVLNKVPFAYDVIWIGFSDSGYGLCGGSEGRFIAKNSGGFFIGQTVYWDTGLQYPLTGAYIRDDADATGKIYNLSSGVIGSFTGNYCN